MNVDVIARPGPDGRERFYLVHDYDVDLLWAEPRTGPFESYDEAEAAADRLTEMLACVGD